MKKEFCLLFVSLSMLHQKVVTENANHLCNITESYFVEVMKTETVLEMKKPTGFSLIGMFSPQSKYENVTKTVPGVEKRFRVVEECCSGYKRKGSECVPINEQSEPKPVNTTIKVTTASSTTSTTTTEASSPMTAAPPAPTGAASSEEPSKAPEPSVTPAPTESLSSSEPSSMSPSPVSEILESSSSSTTVTSETSPSAPEPSSSSPEAATLASTSPNTPEVLSSSTELATSSASSSTNAPEPPSLASEAITLIPTTLPNTPQVPLSSTELVTPQPPSLSDAPEPLPSSTEAATLAPSTLPNVPVVLLSTELVSPQPPSLSDAPEPLPSSTEAATLAPSTLLSVPVVSSPSAELVTPQPPSSPDTPETSSSSTEQVPAAITSEASSPSMEPNQAPSTEGPAHESESVSPLSSNQSQNEPMIVTLNPIPTQSPLTVASNAVPITTVPAPSIHAQSSIIDTTPSISPHPTNTMIVDDFITDPTAVDSDETTIIGFRQKRNVDAHESNKIDVESNTEFDNIEDFDTPVNSQQGFENGLETVVVNSLDEEDEDKTLVQVLEILSFGAVIFLLVITVQASFDSETFSKLWTTERKIPLEIDSYGEYWIYDSQVSLEEV